MERLTRWNEQTEQAELVGYDTEEWKEFKETLLDLNKHFVSTAINQLAIYEDTGLEPHQIDAICDQLNALVDEVLKYKIAEEQGLLLRLPCEVGDTVYSFHTILECKYDYDCKEYDAYKCEGGCPCEFEYRVTRIREQQFEIPMIALLGKSVFLTKSEAEKALAEMR